MSIKKPTTYLESVTQAQLDALIGAHERFLLGKPGGKRFNLPMCKIEGMDLANHNLANAEFPGASLNGSSFNRTKLNSANFFGSDLRGCDMRFADLTNADMRGAQLRGANFENALLKATDLREGHVFSAGTKEEAIKELRSETLANFEDTNFSRATFDGAKLGKGFGGGANLSYSNFRNTRLNEADLSNTNLVGANFDGADLTNTNLSGANLQGANLEGAKINGTKFDNANLTTTKIDIKNLVGIDLSTARLAKTLEAAGLTLDGVLAEHHKWLESMGKEGKQARLESVRISSAELSGKDLSAAIFSSVILDSANMLGAKLSMATMKECSLEKINLVKSDLRGTDFSYAHMIKADISLSTATALQIEYAGKTVQKAANFSMANLTEARAIEANLTMANFTGTVLRDANFGGANLKDAVFNGADVTGMSLIRATYDPAQFEHAIGFETTKR